mmetsp:Transcript_8368/g.26719  ORF Transcript_8368/g.26719 Transcript_8368/m.26719 type:complete len:217 (-) Transcript_8368:463-1113(-)
MVGGRVHEVAHGVAVDVGKAQFGQGEGDRRCLVGGERRWRQDQVKAGDCPAEVGVFGDRVGDPRTVLQADKRAKERDGEHGWWDGHGGKAGDRLVQGEPVQWVVGRGGRERGHSGGVAATSYVRVVLQHCVRIERIVQGHKRVQQSVVQPVAQLGQELRLADSHVVRASGGGRPCFPRRGRAGRRCSLESNAGTCYLPTWYAQQVGEGVADSAERG